MSDMSSVTTSNYEAIKSQRDMLLKQRESLVRRIRDLEERAVASFLGDTLPGWYGTITTADSKFVCHTHKFGPFATMTEVQVQLGKLMQDNVEWIAFKVEYNAGEFIVGDPDEIFPLEPITNE